MNEPPCFATCYTVCHKGNTIPYGKGGAALPPGDIFLHGKIPFPRQPRRAAYR